MRKLPLMTALAGALRRCYALVWPSHTPLLAPSTASPQHDHPRYFDNFHIPKGALTSLSKQRAAPHQPGFTLLELLVVLAIVALASAGVGLALRDGTQTQLEREALRLSALLEAARARSQASGNPVRFELTPNGFVFSGLPAEPNGAPALAHTWLNQDTRASVATAARRSASEVAVLLLGPEPIIARQSLQLYSASQPEQRLHLATDGIRPFTVQPTP